MSGDRSDRQEDIEGRGRFSDIVMHGDRSDRQDTECMESVSDIVTSEERK